MKTLILLNAILAFALAAPTSAQVTIQPLLTFGGGDGWLAPGENDFLTTLTRERGLAYSATTNHLYLVSREDTVDPETTVRIIDATTGLDLGALNTDPAIVTGGFSNFTLNMIGTGADGAIYASNLTLDASTTPYKIYRWETETSVPTVVFEGAPLAGARLGDSLDVTGSGASTLIVAGYNIAANGYAIIDPTAATATSVVFPTNPPKNGDFRLGITFGAQSNVVIGNQGTSAVESSVPRLTTYTDATGTLSANPNFINNATERPMDFAVINGLPLLATIETGTVATANLVRIYDLSNPASPLFLVSLDNTTDPDNPNDFGVGSLKWGAINGGSATLYAMNSNNGIQAFEVLVVVPEPSSIALLVFTAAGLAWPRRRTSTPIQ